MGKYAQEDYARTLHAQFNRELASKMPGMTATVSGAGVHWNCRAKRKQRACTIHCFNASVGDSGPEFLIRFEEKRVPPMWGRTGDQAEVIAAACAWLEGQSVPALYTQFAFVERHHRALEKIEREAVASQPRLAELPTREVVYWDRQSDDSCTLWFRTGDRSCEISYHADKDIANAKCYWDECLQFDIQTEDTLLLARLLKRWLCDNAMPSAIQHQFPSVVLRGVAAFYEQGRGVEGEFLESWGHVEDFYKRIPRPFAVQALHLIGQLRGAGYERTLRAGTSLFNLLVSRSRRHGLEAAQPYIAFTFGDAPFTGGAIVAGEMEVTVCLDAHEQRIAFPNIELSANLNALLKQLEAKAID